MDVATTVYLLPAQSGIYYLPTTTTVWKRLHIPISQLLTYPFWRIFYVKQRESATRIHISL